MSNQGASTRKSHTECEIGRSVGFEPDKSRFLRKSKEGPAYDGVMRRALVDTDNKYSRGVVAIAAGSDRYPGAAILATAGARLGGAGYVKYLSQDQRLQDLVVTRFPDVVPIETLDGSRIDALVVGPGMGTVKSLPEGIPLVLDGEAIQLAFEEGFTGRHPVTVITPHEGELRFCGVEAKTPLNEDERERIARQIAVEKNLIVVLKGHGTVIASDDGEIFIDEIGGAELATAGSGDILAGLIGSLLASLTNGGSAFDLVRRAVTLHSKAGRLASERYKVVTALEIVEALQEV